MCTTSSLKNNGLQTMFAGFSALDEVGRGSASTLRGGEFSHPESRPPKIPYFRRKCTYQSLNTTRPI